MKYVLMGFLMGVGFFLGVGIVTGLFPNTIFKRMTDITIIDYIFLISSSVLIGIFFSLHFYSRKIKYKKNENIYAVTGGAIFSFFAVACPLCNVLLISVVGSDVAAIFF